ncbi:complex I subunit 4 family protein [Methylococcus geothermalis]|uniref:NADH-quinone oxidoreductase subunit M n=1 Tax=Methylococcus geothermalis TaxID=2681310 RepID=A0A858QAK2_9GAMM|nr:NADH-quinone oxidoreductase subunit M [Methylococcus geothermalis]QJD30918.1 NADH-quinone oxidoreductase subunit M [Methylococcus geothermalis]
MTGEIPWSELTGFPVLSTLIGLPLVFMLAALRADRAARAWAIGFAGAVAELGVALFLLSRFDAGTADFQFTEHTVFLSLLNYHLGIDGISLGFVLLTALLTVLVLLFREIGKDGPCGLFVATVLACEATAMGMFLALDLAQFWIAACLEPWPIALILGRWGGGDPAGAARRVYMRFAGMGLALLGGGILLLGLGHARATGIWSFDLAALLAAPPSGTLESLIFVLLFYGFSVRLAQFPLHGWLPIVAEQGVPATALAVLAGMKIGIYGLLRFVLPLLPNAVHEWTEWALGLALAGMFYGAVLALMQLNFRRLMAFATVSQTGMLVAGVFALNLEGLSGTLLLAFNFGAAGAGLFFIAGMLRRRTGTLLLPRLGGLFESLPGPGLLFLVAALSTIAMPGTPGFDAAHLLLEGLIESRGLGAAIAVAVGNVLAAGFLLWAFQRIFLAHRRSHRPYRGWPPLQWREHALIVSLCLVLLGVGFYTAPWLHLAHQALVRLAQVHSLPSAALPASARPSAHPA